STTPRFADSAVWTKSRVRSLTPTPGPITIVLSRLSSSSSANWIALSIARTITAVSAAAFTASASRGEASASPQRAAGCEPRRAGGCQFTGQHDRVAARVFVAVDVRHGERFLPALRHVLERVRPDLLEHMRIDTDIGDADTAAVFPSRHQQM